MRTPRGGKLYGTGLGPVPLTQVPDRPREFCFGDLPRNAARRGGWSHNMYWSFPGLGQVSSQRGRSCTCPCSRFDVDIYGRSFVPRAWRFSAAVLDTNGNLITEVGTYGNADSGRGPDSPVRVNGGVALAHCSYLCTVTDQWLYLHDSGNNRVVQGRLGYAREERVRLEQEPTGPSTGLRTAPSLSRGGPSGF